MRCKKQARKVLKIFKIKILILKLKLIKKLLIRKINQKLLIAKINQKILIEKINTKMLIAKINQKMLIAKINHKKLLELQNSFLTKTHSWSQDHLLILEPMAFSVVYVWMLYILRILFFLKKTHKLIKTQLLWVKSLKNWHKKEWNGQLY